MLSVMAILTTPIIWLHAKSHLPLTDAFSGEYFERLRADSSPKLSVKAFLATEQRVPGLGNGVLQDILYCAGIHPKRKLGTLADTEYAKLYRCVIDTLRDMVRLGGARCGM